MDLTFGLTEGWWLPRTWTPLGYFPLVRDQWQALLADMGSADTQLIPGEEQQMLEQVVIVSQNSAAEGTPNDKSLVDIC